MLQSRFLAVVLLLGTGFAAAGTITVALRLDRLEEGIREKSHGGERKRDVPAMSGSEISVESRLAALETEMQRLNSAVALSTERSSAEGAPSPAPGLESVVETVLQERQKQEDAARKDRARQRALETWNRELARWRDQVGGRLDLSATQRDALARLFEGGTQPEDPSNVDVWDVAARKAEAIRAQLSADQAQRFAALLADEKPRRLGVGNADAILPQEAARLGLSVGQGGLWVSDVRPDSAGGRAGLMEGDLVVAVGGHPLPQEDPRRGLREVLQQVAPGTPVPLTIVRNGQRVTLTAQWEW